MTPKVLTPEQAAEICDCSPATMERYRKDMSGPNFIRTPGGHIKYLEEDVFAWLRSLRQQPSEADKMKTAATHGLKEVGGTVRTRMQQLADASKPESEPDPYAVTVSDVGGSAPGIEKLVFQDGKWVKNGTLSQTVVQPAAEPHLLNCR
ncbi:MAG: helix-turn-helix domain-containing protein [Azonexus sp.]|nr:helix-turn-helix domain-containing protein [Azonexus sp.]